MFQKSLLTLLLAGLFSSQAQAAVELIAIGTLSGSHDLSGLSGTLENGVSADILGGMGSGFAWAGGNTFIATPDRGPNAVSYNSAIDDTTSYISRFNTLTMNLTANTSGTGLAYSLTPTLTSTTLLYSSTTLNYGSGVGMGNKIDGVTPIGSGAPTNNDATHQYFTGRSDNFGTGSSSNTNNGRLDPEGVRVSNDGKSVFVSDEYGPYIYQFDRATGERINTFTLPSNLAIAHPSASGTTEQVKTGANGNTTGRVANKGMEGLAITPDGKTLIGIMQAPLLQDAKNQLRIVTVDIATGATKEFGYTLTTGSGVSEIVAANDHTIYVDERDGKGKGDGTAAVEKKIYKVDLTGAIDISNVASMTSSTPTVSKTAIADLVAILKANGIADTEIPAKIEGLAFGEDVMVNGVMKHTLYVTNDNDFVSAVAGENKFYVLALTDADLGTTYTAQSIAVAAIPETDSYAMLLAGLGMMGWVVRRKKQ